MPDRCERCIPTIAAARTPLPLRAAAAMILQPFNQETDMATDRTDDKRPLTGRDGKLGDHDSNPDPITKAPGAHPTGVGIGAAAGGATGVGAAMAVGAATGSVAGPIGTAIGIIAGAIVGGYVGKGVGEAVDPTEDDKYWREN